MLVSIRLCCAVLCCVVLCVAAMCGSSPPRSARAASRCVPVRACDNANRVLGATAIAIRGGTYGVVGVPSGWRR